MAARQGFAAVLALLAVVCALVGGVALFANERIVDRRTFADLAVETLDREEVRTAVSDAIGAQVAARVPGAFLPQEQVDRAIDRAVETPAFRRAFRRAALDANDVLFGDRQQVASLGLGDVTPALAAADPRLAQLLPAGAEARLLTLRSDTLGVGTERIGDTAGTLGAVLPALAAMALLVAVILAPDRRRLLRLVGVAALVAGAALLAFLAIGRSFAIDRVRTGAGVSLAEAQDAASAAWDVYAGPLRGWAIGAIVAGAVIAVLTFVPGRRRAAY